MGLGENKRHGGGRGGGRVCALDRSVNRVCIRTAHPAIILPIHPKVPLLARSKCHPASPIVPSTSLDAPYYHERAHLAGKLLFGTVVDLSTDVRALQPSARTSIFSRTNLGPWTRSMQSLFILLLILRSRKQIHPLFESRIVVYIDAQKTTLRYIRKPQSDHTKQNLHELLWLDLVEILLRGSQRILHLVEVRADALSTLFLATSLVVVCREQSVNRRSDSCTDLSAEYLRDLGGPSAGIHSLGPECLGYMVDVGNLLCVSVDTEHVDRFP